jgi:hypothetical protein
MAAQQAAFLRVVGAADSSDEGAGDGDERVAGEGDACGRWVARGRMAWLLHSCFQRGGVLTR